MHRLHPIFAVVVSLVSLPHAVHAQDLTTPSGCRFMYAGATFSTTTKEYTHLRLRTWDFLPDGRVFEFRQTPTTAIVNQVGTWSMIGDQILVVSHQDGSLAFKSKISMYMTRTSSDNEFYFRSALQYVGRAD
jgi:hypothetical protein